MSGSRPGPAALWLCLACSWASVVQNALEMRGPPSFLLWLLRLDDPPGYGQLRPKQTVIRGCPRTTDSEAVSGARVDLRAAAPRLCEQDPGVSGRDLSLYGRPQSTCHHLSRSTPPSWAYSLPHPEDWCRQLPASSPQGPSAGGQHCRSRRALTPLLVSTACSSW